MLVTKLWGYLIIDTKLLVTKLLITKILVTKWLVIKLVLTKLSGYPIISYQKSANHKYPGNLWGFYTLRIVNSQLSIASERVAKIGNDFKDKRTFLF